MAISYRASLIMERYRLYQKLSDKISDIIESVLAGESEKEACVRNGVSQSQFRRLMNSHWDQEVSEQIKFTSEQTYDWQETFLKDLFNNDVYPLPDFEAAFSRAISTLSEKQQYAVTHYYKYGQTYDEIGQDLGLTRERIRQILAKTLRQLRVPRIANAFIYGDELNFEIKEVDEQLRQAQNLLQEKKDALSLLATQSKEIDKQFNNYGVADVDIALLKTKSIHTLHMSRRTTQALLRAGIYNIGDIQALSANELWHIRSLGNKGIAEITSAMDKINIQI